MGGSEPYLRTKGVSSCSQTMSNRSAGYIDKLHKKERGEGEGEGEGGREREREGGRDGAHWGWVGKGCKESEVCELMLTDDASPA